MKFHQEKTRRVYVLLSTYEFRFCYVLQLNNPYIRRRRVYQDWQLARVRIALLTVRTPSECCWMSKVSKAVFKTVSVLCLCSVSTCLDKNSTSSLKLPAPEWLRTELKKLSISDPRTSQDSHYVQPGLVNKVYFLLRSVRAPNDLPFQVRQLCSDKDTI